MFEIMNYGLWLEQQGDLERYKNSPVCKVAEDWGYAILTIIRGMGVKGNHREYQLMRRIICRDELPLLLDNAKKYACSSEPFKAALEKIKKISKYHPDYLKKIMCAPMLDEPITIEVIEGASVCYIVTSACTENI
ncbi:hypothetical protein GLP21_12205 [Photobacterium carnosum]|nr:MULTISPECIES: hypothetical protein [Photobacterium]MCD9549391.1 hypothetical protein [Photobacterium carnosum]